MAIVSKDHRDRHMVMRRHECSYSAFQVHIPGGVPRKDILHDITKGPGIFQEAAHRCPRSIVFIDNHDFDKPALFGMYGLCVFTTI